MSEVHEYVFEDTKTYSMGGHDIVMDRTLELFQHANKLGLKGVLITAVTAQRDNKNNATIIKFLTGQVQHKAKGEERKDDR